MGFSQAVGTCFRKYATFSGRARRSEYWWFMLFYAIGALGLEFLDRTLFAGNINGIAPLSSLFNLATLLPTISVAVRRLHDRGKSGWWYWLFLIPLVGALVLIIWFISRGTAGPNAYGPDPLSDQGTGDQDGANKQTCRPSAIPTVRRD